MVLENRNLISPGAAHAPTRYSMVIVDRDHGKRKHFSDRCCASRSGADSLRVRHGTDICSLNAPLSRPAPSVMALMSAGPTVAATIASSAPVFLLSWATLLHLFMAGVAFTCCCMCLWSGAQLRSAQRGDRVTPRQLSALPPPSCASHTRARPTEGFMQCAGVWDAGLWREFIHDSLSQ